MRGLSRDEDECMNFWTEERRISITCPKGIAPWLGGEVRGLGFPLLGESEAVVETSGTLGDTMRFNLCLRTGYRVLYEVATFTAKNPVGLYDALRAFPWEDLLHERGEHAYLSVTSTVDH